ncbi:hypothetical protein I6N98_02070 [Spongiibacter nanhainus]|uniref:Uncharacterized protein n=1 Tax=Spongiibacter nanhainus TaxID=2794344 RepID=A0A7T4UQY4_9GAMM|nr:hypothetical protein [Spongiibacter nanhainus]QQD18683.1 hypothetical protein I6N98_02070 [Spongiibacter nanhainus]
MKLYIVRIIFLFFAFTGVADALNWKDFVTVNGKPLSQPGDESEVSGEKDGENGKDPIADKSTKHYCYTLKYENRPDSRDPRWCMNMILEGGVWHDVPDSETTIPVRVNLAYVRAKRFLKFEDPDDQKANANSRYNSNTSGWDGIPGTYYRVKGTYGGPRIKDPILWRAPYEVEFEAVNDNETKVILSYRVYGRDVEPRLFQQQLMDALR